MNVKGALFVNGQRATEIVDIQTSDMTHEDGKGQALLLARLPVDFTFTFFFDPEELRAIQRKPDFGFAHLRALLDALPRCQKIGCNRVATHSEHPDEEGGYVYNYCEEHAGGRPNTVLRPLRYAPVVRHLERAVLDFEQRNVVGAI